MPQLRTATIEDAGRVADLESAITPDDPRDGELIAFWWTNGPAAEKSIRWLAERDGAAVMYVSARHHEWKEGEGRFGSITVRIHPEEWNQRSYLESVERAEGWLRAEGASTSYARIREDFDSELRLLEGRGFREVRRDRYWRLDLVGGRERLLATAEKTRADMGRQGVTMLTLDQDSDRDALQQLYALDLEASEDIPKTVPWPVPAFDEWCKHWFEHPAHRKDRFWIAREGNAIVGMSVIAYPPRRGIPWTSFTGTSRRVRGRGIARALKYETVAQAIAVGLKSIETANDAENAPILHLNEEMGYRAALPVIEMHHELGG